MSIAETHVEAAGPLASWRHTLVLCLIFLGLAALGYAGSHAVAAGQVPASGLQLYVPLLMTQWLLFAFVASGLWSKGTRLKNVIAHNWTWRSIGSDIVAGIVLLAAWLAIERLWATFGPAETGHSAGELLHARTEVEIWVWIALSVSAGFVEELTFRGYLLRQFGMALRSPFLGLIVQAILFGVSHGYQGLDPVVRITTFGLLFGTVALLRGSTRSGMIAHASIDVIGGLLP